jgi:hypothetical protein
LPANYRKRFPYYDVAKQEFATQFAENEALCGNSIRSPA